ncbi:MAG: LLM class flavin-dependent oxidoreductase [Dehalococcoidia bacterium]
MDTKRIGIAAYGADALAVVSEMVRFERLGVAAVWLTTGGARLDGLTLSAVAAMRTGKIMLGTSIVPIFPRHPIVVAQQVQVVAQLAPGRFRLGLGPSGQQGVLQTFGLDFKFPLGHLREYVDILRTLLRTGSVDFAGDFYKTRARINKPVEVPIMTSALNAGAYRLAGEIADGAISWVNPGKYLRDVALPAMREGAQKAGREVPPLIAHAPVCVHDNRSEVFAAVREQLATYPRLPFYARMFEAAGYPEAHDGTWSDAMIEAVAIWGDKPEVGGRLSELLSWGATEVIVTPVAAGPDRQASTDRTVQLIADLAMAT